ncbi:hypothetical protein [Algivirga pacifica]|uniref:Calx-beta domain-containing protein n=1 Tax=Algivirga pacifica TaxID=1162670 RepID=A0ABP9DDV0_9BACT
MRSGVGLKTKAINQQAVEPTVVRVSDGTLKYPVIHPKYTYLIPSGTLLLDCKEERFSEFDLTHEGNIHMEAFRVANGAHIRLIVRHTATAEDLSVTFDRAITDTASVTIPGEQEVTTLDIHVIKHDEDEYEYIVFVAGIEDGQLKTISTRLSTLESGTGKASWENVSGKPSTFPPSTHTHDWSNGVTAKPFNQLGTEFKNNGGSLEVQSIDASKINNLPTGGGSGVSNLDEAMAAGTNLTANYQVDLPEDGNFTIRGFGTFLGDTDGQLSVGSSFGKLKGTDGFGGYSEIEAGEFMGFMAASDGFDNSQLSITGSGLTLESSSGVFGTLTDYSARMTDNNHYITLLRGKQLLGTFIDALEAEGVITTPQNTNLKTAIGL